MYAIITKSPVEYVVANHGIIRIFTVPVPSSINTIMYHWINYRSDTKGDIMHYEIPIVAVLAFPPPPSWGSLEPNTTTPDTITFEPTDRSLLGCWLSARRHNLVAVCILYKSKQCIQRIYMNRQCWACCQLTYSSSWPRTAQYYQCTSRRPTMCIRCCVIILNFVIERPRMLLFALNIRARNGLLFCYYSLRILYNQTAIV